MAIAAAAIWEIGPSGSKDNGGGYVPGAGVDYSQQDSPQANLTGLTTGGATDIVTTALADANWLNNIVKAPSGTNVTVGFYQIIAVTPGVSFQLDRNWCTGVVANGVVNVGGRWKFGNDSGDDLFLDAGVAGNKYWCKTGLYQCGSISLTSVAGSNPKLFEGYNTVRGDRPTTIATMPVIDFGASNTSTTGNTWDFRNIITLHGSVSGWNMGSNSREWDTKHFNTSIIAGRAAVTAGTDNILTGMEAVAMRGNAVTHNGTPRFISCYLHDSNNGANHSGTSANPDYIDCIFAGNINAALNDAAARSVACLIKNCVLWGYSGATYRVGTGWALASGALDSMIMNSVIAGFTTGLNHADAEGNNPMNISDYNCFHNNGTDRTNWTAGPNDIALDPEFSITQHSGTTATTSNVDNSITQPGATFQTWGIPEAVNGVPQAWLRMVSGTGVTTGIYGILTVPSETKLTLNAAPGTSATADKTWVIEIRNFEPGTNLQRAAMPIAGDIGTNYRDIGAFNSDGTDWWSGVLESKAESGLNYRENSLTNNKTGTLASGGGGSYIRRR